MMPVIKAKRWWWLPDRKKAKLANIVQQYQMNKKRDEIERMFKSIYQTGGPVILVAKNKRQQREWQKEYPHLEVLIEERMPE